MFTIKSVGQRATFVGVVSPGVTALAIGLLTAGCGRSPSVSTLPENPAPPVVTSHDPQQAEPVGRTERAAAGLEPTSEGAPASSSSVGDVAALPPAAGTSETPPASPDEPAAERQKAEPASAERPDRPVGLGQFGGGRGGGGGGRGGGGGGFGGGGGGFGGGGGGLGGGGGGGLGGGGGGLGGGVAIDPKVQLKADSSGKLDQRRKEATAKKPAKGGFASD